MEESETKMANKSSKKNDRADELERVITHLDTLYERGDECVHPDTRIAVSDGEYDAMRRELAGLRPDSKLFQTATASQLESSARKIVHDPPLTSIDKASHEDIEVQQEQLFKWMHDSAEGLGADPDAKGALKVKGKKYKDQPVAYSADMFYEAWKAGQGWPSSTRRHQWRSGDRPGQIRLRCSREAEEESHLLDPWRADLQKF